MTQCNDGLTDLRVHGERNRRDMPVKRLFLKALLPALLIAVVTVFTNPVDSSETEIRKSKKPTTFLGAVGDQLILWQNWDDDKRQEFWFTEQGSQIIPYDWALVLEIPNSEEPFFGNKNMDRLRYIPQSETPKNLDKLPIGFTKDMVWYSNESLPGGASGSLRITYKNHGDKVYQKISKEWLGMTCAACHTNQIEYKGKKIVIDGAPGMGDLEGFLHGLVESMQATLEDKDKFQRFATKVGEKREKRKAKNKTNVELKEQLATMINIRKAWNTRNSGDGVKFGFGRLDAINSIMNEITSKALKIPENRRPANAPVSYPFIWDAPHHDYIQWNGMVANDAKGALGRNVGEVLGVFGTVKFKPSYFPVNPKDIFERRANLALPAPGYESSVRIPNLGKLEHLLVSLWSPLWPETVLPKLQPKLVKDGEKIFMKQCAGCHGTIEAENKKRRITSTAVPVGVTGTDDAMARIFFDRPAKTGHAQGQYVGYFPMKNGKFDRHVPKFEKDKTVAAAILRHAVAGTIAHDRFGAKTVIEKTILSGFRTVSPNDQPKTASYKARPLNGIWATAPYLHNGSVPTLMQLLKPSKREKVFFVGSRAFDAKEVGFKYKETDYGPDEPKFRFDTTKDGNRNTGHTYFGNYFETHTEKFEALMEYLKSL